MSHDVAVILAASVPVVVALVGFFSWLAELSNPNYRDEIPPPEKPIDLTAITGMLHPCPGCKGDAARFISPYDPSCPVCGGTGRKVSRL